VNQPNKVELQAAADVGEGKARGQGELLIVQHIPGTERVQHVPGTVEGTRSGETEQEDPLHCSSSPRHNCISSGLLLRLKAKGSTGRVDGVTWQEYEQDLENRLTGLQNRIHSGTYRAPTFVMSLHSKSRRTATSAGHRCPSHGSVRGRLMRVVPTATGPELHRRSNHDLSGDAASALFRLICLHRWHAPYDWYLKRLA